MLNRKKLVLGLLILAVAGASAWLYLQSHGHDAQSARENLLSHLPADSTSVVYVDFQELRASAFLSQILAWAPRPQAEEEYAKFVQATGFDYERDLDRMGVSFSGSAQSPKTMAVAEGRFERKKIESYSEHFGTLKTANGKTIYAVNLSNPPRTAYFTFLRDDEVAICNDASCFFQASGKSMNSEEWREHFLRMAGTPGFAVADGSFAADAGRISFAATGYAAGPIAMGLRGSKARRRRTARGGGWRNFERNGDPPIERYVQRPADPGTSRARRS